MSERFEFVPGDEIDIRDGRTLKRIRALVAIEAIGVKPGDLGGYVERADNVSGEAWISGEALIGADARISGPDGVFVASGVGTQAGTLTAVLDSCGRLLLTRGCFCGSAAEFLARSAAQHDERIQREYRMLIEVAASRLGVEVAA